jgi:transcriptional regulator with XRE-family HTH domain
MTLGKRIEQKRLSKNLKKKELAKLINVHDTLIGKYERDEVDLGLSKIKELARVLDTTPAYLMGWEDNQKENIDIANMVNDLMDNLNSNQALMYSGEPMDEVTKELVRASIEQAARIAMARHKSENDN